MPKPMFQKRHYEAIASVLFQAIPQHTDDDSSRWQREHIIELLAQMFRADNPDFKSGRFRLACQDGQVTKRRE